MRGLHVPPEAEGRPHGGGGDELGGATESWARLSQRFWLSLTSARDG
jgi:hypothetical protein